MCHKKHGKTFTLERFKEMMGIKDKKTYALYGKIKQDVLEIAKREIDEKTDIKFCYTEIKGGEKGAKVVALKLKALKNKKALIINAEIPKSIPPAAWKETINKLKKK